MKKNKIKFCVLLYLSIMMVSCSDEIGKDTISEENAEKIYLQGKDKELFPLEQENTTTYRITNESDLQRTLNKKATQYEESLLNNGWTKLDDATQIQTRAKINVRVDTLYVIKYTVDYNSDPSVYNLFKATFSNEMVDKINAYVDPVYRISSKKTYICEWRLFSAMYEFSDKEKISARNSPYCALTPVTKNGFTERGYTGYINKTSHQFQMSSYQLVIKYENVKNTTTILDIEWPIYSLNPTCSYRPSNSLIFKDRFF